MTQNVHKPCDPFNVTDFFPSGSIVRSGEFISLDEVDTTLFGSLVYCQNLHYLQKAKNNSNVSAIICPVYLLNELSNSRVAVIAGDDPRQLFFNLYCELKDSGLMLPEIDFGIGLNCRIHTSAIISRKTHIGNGVVIGANAVVEDYCKIGNNVFIGPNVVIGAEGMLTLRQHDGSLKHVCHAGGVEICDGCQVLTGAVIAKSLFHRFTHLGRYTQIGILASIGHGVYIGDSCVVSGNSVIAGRTRLEDGVWIGASVTVAQGLVIGENAKIKMGSVVVADVSPRAVLSGNFAVNHRINMKRYLRS